MESGQRAQCCARVDAQVGLQAEPQWERAQLFKLPVLCIHITCKALQLGLGTGWPPKLENPSLRVSHAILFPELLPSWRGGSSVQGSLPPCGNTSGPSLPILRYLSRLGKALGYEY